MKPTRKGKYLHPLPVRIWHWVNAFLMLCMIATGVFLRYGILLTFETAFILHNWIGVLLILVWFMWFFYYAFSDYGKTYFHHLKFKDFYNKFLLQLKYYGYDIFVGGQKPHHITPLDKFNPMQKVSYHFIMFFVLPISMITGIVMWQFGLWLLAVEMLKLFHVTHTLIFILLTFFMGVHIYMGFLGKKPSTHYKEMITGYEE